MNIYLHKIKEKDFGNDFFDMLVARGFTPWITFPTRISNSSATGEQGRKSLKLARARDL